MPLLQPCVEHLPAYAEALHRGWSPDNLRAQATAQAHLRRIAEDPEAFVAALTDREARGAPVTLPDGSSVPRLPGYTLWIWEGGFCGAVNLRWQPGTPALPPHVLGHVGYGVVPWRRGQGIAQRALAELLPRAQAEGLPHILLTTDPDNAASRRVIEANGGVLLERFEHPAALGGGASLRYRIDLDPAALFVAGPLRVFEMREADLAEVQAFYDANPGYHEQVAGAPPGPGEARADFEARPPGGWLLGRKWMLLARDGQGAVVAVVDVLEDLFCRGVWCIGFFMVATRLHGTGAAVGLHEALVRWMRARGARWSRLGVVETNARAAGFWRSRGYRELRRRLDYPVGARTHPLVVMARALEDSPDWQEYLRSVPRDDPASP